MTARPVLKPVAAAAGRFQHPIYPIRKAHPFSVRLQQGGAGNEMNRVKGDGSAAAPAGRNSGSSGEAAPAMFPHGLPGRKARGGSWKLINRIAFQAGNQFV